MAKRKTKQEEVMPLGDCIILGLDISTKSNYLYMIRETGGYLTGAYVDDRNVSKVGVNPYYNSNIGNESYLLEIGYLSNSSDFNILLKNKDKLAKVIGDSIIKELKVE